MAKRVPPVHPEDVHTDNSSSGGNPPNSKTQAFEGGYEDAYRGNAISCAKVEAASMLLVTGLLNFEEAHVTKFYVAL